MLKWLIASVLKGQGVVIGVALLCKMILRLVDYGRLNAEAEVLSGMTRDLSIFFSILDVVIRIRAFRHIFCYCFVNQLKVLAILL